MKYFPAILLLILLGIGAGYFVNHQLHQSASVGFHNAMVFKQDFYEPLFKNLKPRDTDAEKIKAVIVNHHLLAAHFMADVFNKVALNKQKTVVLISPDHFYRGKTRVTVTLYDWKTPYGVLKSAKSLIKKIAAQQNVRIDPDPFKNEHGIFNLIPFIKRALPAAKIIPIIVKDNLNDIDADSFAEKLNEFLPRDALVIGSFDFSHDVTSQVADEYDAQSLAIIRNMDYENVKDVHIDSKPGLRIILKYLVLRGAREFYLLNNSNSSKLLKQDRNDTTSYITGYFTANETAVE